MDATEQNTYPYGGRRLKHKGRSQKYIWMEVTETFKISSASRLGENSHLKLLDLYIKSLFET